MSTPEHALECAALVDDAVRDVLRQTSLMQPQKAAILAALTLADQLLQTRNELDSLRRDSDRLASHLAGEVERRMAAG
jgi:cell division protein ZapA (FtsZ GTPase activity inhibitor)